MHVLEIAMLVTEEDKVSLNLVKLGLGLKLQLRQLLLKETTLFFEFLLVIGESGFVVLP